MTRAARLAYWTLPSLICLLVYWHGLRAWFTTDDFAWLGLRLSIYTWRDFLHSLFEPRAQGTIRPLSERGFYLLFEWLFGLNALPFRIWAFVTQFANLVLLSAIALRLTRSRIAGFCAPVFWALNAGLATPMAWTAAYNQLLCAFFLLLSSYWFVRFCETGERRFYAAQWLSFLLGFGALELNVVYPALAFSYALFMARRYLWHTIPMFAASAAYTLLHNHYAPTTAQGLYALHWDLSIVRTLWLYTKLSMGPTQLIALFGKPVWYNIGTAVLLVGLGAFAAWKIWCGEWLAAFFLSWYLIVLSPFLPLRDHIMDYYYALPAIGLAMLGAWAVSEAWKSIPAARAIALALTFIYIASSVIVSHSVIQWRFDRSREMRDLVWGVVRAHELHPGKIILLRALPNDTFWAGFTDDPFRLLGISEIYLVPGSESAIDAHPEIAPIGKFVLPPEDTLKALNADLAVVYDASGSRLRNVTSVYKEMALESFKPGLPKQVDAGHPLYSAQLGPTWYSIDDGFRWMPKTATIRLGGPTSASEKLYLHGFAPSQLFQNGPVHLQVSVDGQKLAVFTLTSPDSQFELSCNVPPGKVGAREIVVELAVDKSFVPPQDGRELTLTFGKISLQ